MEHDIFSLYDRGEDGALSITLYGGIVYSLPEPPRQSEMLNSEKPVSDQKWKRTPIPKFAAKDITWFIDEPDDFDIEITWEEARRQEVIGQTGLDFGRLNNKGEPIQVKTIKPNEEFCIEVLNDFRRRELYRCCPWTEGVWIMIGGKAVYLTPYYYKYIQWNKNDNGYPDFYWEECKAFYHWQYVKESEIDLGRLEGTQRGRGKSARMQSVAMDEVSWNENAHVTGQGRNDTDVEDFFAQKIVVAYKSLPDFLVPINSNSTNPTVKLKFSPPARSGKFSSAFLSDQRKALNSVLDYNKAGEKACDRLTIKFYYCEEPGKTPPPVADVFKRTNVVRECIWRNSRKVGNMWLATTVEEQDEGGEAFRSLWQASNPAERDANGQTRSGLVHYFISAADNTYFDEFGFSDTEKALKWIYNRRDALKDKPDEYRQFVRKFPLSEEEMFLFGSGGGVFNESILSEAQIKLSSSGDSKTRRIKFVKEENGRIGWREFSDAPWEVSWLPDDKEFKSNNYENGYSIYYYGGIKQKSSVPLNNSWIRAACDPVSHIAEFLEEERKGSDNACVIRTKTHPSLPSEFCNLPIAIYRERTNDPEDAYEQMLFGLMYYGVAATIETNKDGFRQYLFRKKMMGFINPKKGTEHSNDPKPGQPSGQGLIDFYTGEVKTDIERNGLRYKHLQLVEEMFKFDPKETKKFDVVVAFGLSFVGDNDTDEQAEDDSLDIKKIFGH
jgi:hypothetical protein